VGIGLRALVALEVDAIGLDAMDRRYLSTIAVNYGGGPAYDKPPREFCSARRAHDR
jgi:Holliday junction resolvasome RuvABC ATP-dependent DNA helicase subunit